MANGFAEQSGGALAIESAPGRGTAVNLWLPIAAAAPTEAAQVRPGLAPVDSLARRVLVVEDQDIVRGVLVASLDDAGFAVLASSNGADGLVLLEAGDPVDALVSAVAMPATWAGLLIR
jgi:hypothetical protein